MHSTRAVRRGLLVVLLAAALGGVRCNACREEASREAPADPAVHAVGSAAGRYVGSEACAPCHETIAIAWRASRHRATLRPFGANAVPRLVGSDLPDGFAVGADGTTTAPGPDGRPMTARAAYLAGGRHREDLWVRMDDGRLQVFPISFDVDEGRPFEPLRALAGGASPAADTVDHWTRFGRSADLACYGCHATGAHLENSGPSIERAVPRSRWAEAGVGCEGCHGPGGAHVAAAAAGRKDSAGLNMTKGQASGSAVAACGGCHGLRELLGSPFDAAPAHRYGVPVGAWADVTTRTALDLEFRDATFADLRPGTYQQEAVALGQSGCARRGGLTCAACHDAHSGGLTAAASGPDGGDAACLPCHADVARAGRSHSGHEPGQPGGRCFDCHLAPIVRGPGSAPARDHTLAPPAATSGEVPAACARCHDGDAAGAMRAAWGARSSTAPSAQRRLALARAFGSSQGPLDRRSGMLGSIAGDAGEAWFIRAAALREVLPLVEAGGGRDAAAGARDALASTEPPLRRAAARVLARCGDGRDFDALAALAEDADPFVALEAAVALSTLGDPGAGPRLTRVLRRPDLLGEYRAHMALGRQALAARDWPRAESALLKALHIHPLIVSAWNDLGIARFSAGSAPTAQAAWERALALNPRYDAARRNIDAAGTSD